MPGRRPTRDEIEPRVVPCRALPRRGRRRCQVKAAGLTQNDLARELEAGLRSGYLKDPKVTVSVLEFRPFFILGEVEKPGSYPYSSGLNVMSAIATAVAAVRASRTWKVRAIRRPILGRPTTPTARATTDRAPSAPITSPDRTASDPPSGERMATATPPAGRPTSTRSTRRPRQIRAPAAAARSSSVASRVGRSQPRAAGSPGAAPYRSGMTAPPGATSRNVGIGAASRTGR